MPETHAFSDLRPRLKTGDIVLMGGTSIFSRAIRKLTGSDWSHVAMVVRVEEYDTVLLWESTTNGHDKDVQTGEIKRGVQLVPLSKRVSEHTGNLAFRLLSRELTRTEIGRLNAFRHSVKDKGYDFDGLELLRAALDSGLFWSNREDLTAYFCSELIAETYQAIGFLDKTKPSNEYTPDDFSVGAAPPLELQGGVHLGDEIVVSRESD
ncbi:MAG: YiiX/YebB-like N1pC/P60 family cysteine hydrolase [Defluviicoccus sp.]|nr:YiiX/YebB-like N1pC/P60 family cysteine hydrolase [Defluviicoccus sp.]MDE0278815.1 YiiX/YebB-like N1pC/P60 family cysteine hydrolase [Defluviicoccus sp.]